MGRASFLLCVMVASVGMTSEARGAVLAETGKVVRSDRMGAIGVVITDTFDPQRQGDIPRSSLCRRGGETTNENGALSVLAGRPVCRRAAAKRAGRRVTLVEGTAGRGAGGGFGSGLGAWSSIQVREAVRPPLPQGSNGEAATFDADPTGNDSDQSGQAVAARGLTLPAYTLTAAALPSLKPPATPPPLTKTAATPVPAAAWFFGSTFCLLLLKRRTSPVL